MKLLPVIFFAVMLTSCASMKPVAFENSEPKLDPMAFFRGRTESHGVIENRHGAPTTPIITKTVGTVTGNKLHLEQDLVAQGQKPNHRSWVLTRLDEHHVTATANDIDGKANGLLYGNHFAWTFRLKLKNRKFIRHVRMSQNYYLMPGSQSLIIRSVIRKFGFTVAQITEVFVKQ